MRKTGRTYIIAEAGVNHNGSMDLAMKLIDAAVDAGADAVKFQTFKADKLVSKDAPKAEYQKNTTGPSETQYEMIKKLELTKEDHFLLMDYSRGKGIEFLSTPFDLESVDLLVEELQLPRLKISSGDLTNAPLLLKVARTRKPIILSTGMADLGEIEMALAVLAFGYLKPNHAEPSISAFQQAYSSIEAEEALQEMVTLLHCTTEYPAPLEDVNLRAMTTLEQSFGLPVGFSDHTEGITIPIASVARGAMLVEKHFTLDKSLPGPDHKASLEPAELKAMVSAIRQVEMALGASRKVPALSEIKNKPIARKSVVAAKEIKSGELFTTDNLTVKRPGNGVSPFYYWDLMGREASKDYEKDEAVTR